MAIKAKKIMTGMHGIPKTQHKNTQSFFFQKESLNSILNKTAAQKTPKILCKMNRYLNRKIFDTPL